MKQDIPANLSFIEPMNALLARDLPSGNWLYEVKFDGYRALNWLTICPKRLRQQSSCTRTYPMLPVDKMQDAGDLQLFQPVEKRMIQPFALVGITQRPAHVAAMPDALKVLILTGGDSAVDLTLSRQKTSPASRPWRSCR